MAFKCPLMTDLGCSFYHSHPKPYSLVNEHKHFFLSYWTCTHIFPDIAIRLQIKKVRTHILKPLISISWMHLMKKQVGQNRAVADRQIERLFREAPGWSFLLHCKGQERKVPPDPSLNTWLQTGKGCLGFWSATLKVPVSPINAKNTGQICLSLQKWQIQVAHTRSVSLSQAAILISSNVTLENEYHPVYSMVSVGCCQLEVENQDEVCVLWRGTNQPWWPGQVFKYNGDYPLFGTTIWMQKGCSTLKNWCKDAV